MTPHQPHPLILTALLDPASQARFEEERQAYFPPALNFIAAHVTLFHHLPGAELATIDRQLGECCRAGAAAPFSTTGLRFMGRGTAYLLSMPAISGLRASLAERWRPWLTPQDRQGWQAHVTVQNKVAPDVARRLHASLQARFSQRDGMVLGLDLWHYLGGPWEKVAQYAFLDTIA